MPPSPLSNYASDSHTQAAAESRSRSELDRLPPEVWGIILSLLDGPVESSESSRFGYIVTTKKHPRSEPPKPDYFQQNVHSLCMAFLGDKPSSRITATREAIFSHLRSIQRTLFSHPRTQLSASTLQQRRGSRIFQYFEEALLNLYQAPQLMTRSSAKKFAEKFAKPRTEISQIPGELSTDWRDIVRTITFGALPSAQTSRSLLGCRLDNLDTVILGRQSLPGSQILSLRRSVMQSMRSLEHDELVALLTSLSQLGKINLVIQKQEDRRCWLDMKEVLLDYRRKSFERPRFNSVTCSLPAQPLGFTAIPARTISAVIDPGCEPAERGRRLDQLVEAVKSYENDDPLIDQAPPIFHFVDDTFMLSDLGVKLQRIFNPQDGRTADQWTKSPVFADRKDYVYLDPSFKSRFVPTESSHQIAGPGYNVASP